MKKKLVLDIVLKSYDAASKVKIIKEVKTIFNLGLKEVNFIEARQKTRWTVSLANWRKRCQDKKLKSSQSS